MDEGSGVGLLRRHVRARAGGRLWLYSRLRACIATPLLVRLHFAHACSSSGNTSRTWTSSHRPTEPHEVAVFVLQERAVVLIHGVCPLYVEILRLLRIAGGIRGVPELAADPGSALLQPESECRSRRRREEEIPGPWCRGPSTDQASDCLPPRASRSDRSACESAERRLRVGADGRPVRFPTDRLPARTTKRRGRLGARPGGRRRMRRARRARLQASSLL